MSLTKHHTAMNRFCIVMLLLTIGLTSCQNNNQLAADVNEPNVKRMPAEYDEQDAVWLIWSPVDHKEGYSNEEVTIQIIEAIVPHTKVILTTASNDLLERAKDVIPEGLLTHENFEIIQIPSEELWIRDMGPNFVELTNGEKAIVDFGFDAWGYTPIDEMDEYTITMEKFDEAVAELRKLPLLSTDLISEGGDREVNGKGVLLVVETVEQGRNPAMTKSQMNAEFKRVLGVEKVIWLKEGLYEDDHTFRGTIALKDGTPAYTVVTTNGHIDEFARFVNDSTILLAEVPAEDMHDPVAAENHKRMEVNYEILKNATDQNGHPFNIVRMPLPELIVDTMKPGDSVYDYISTLTYEDGSTFPTGDPVTVIAAASYLNFLISEHVIIGQKYWRDGWDISIKERDEQVKDILAELFPEREVVMIDALAINFGGGGIHCITMQEPKI